MAEVLQKIVYNLLIRSLLFSSTLRYHPTFTRPSTGGEYAMNERLLGPSAWLQKLKLHLEPRVPRGRKKSPSIEVG